MADHKDSFLSSTAEKNVNETTDLEDEVARLTAERRELFARLAELESERTTQAMELFTMAAHELRTPLQSLLMTTDLMLSRMQSASGEVPREWLLAHLKIQEGALGRLQSLMDAWLAAPQLRAGTLPTVSEPLDLAELVRAQVTRYASDLAWAGCTVETVLQPTRGRWDRLRLESVLGNLLTNAMKYGAGKPIEVSVTRDAKAATIVVRDYGIGIAGADQERIFERFERVSSGPRVPGFGVGLWMARALLRAMNGTLTVESAPAKGAAFVVRLPVTDE